MPLQGSGPTGISVRVCGPTREPCRDCDFRSGWRSFVGKLFKCAVWDVSVGIVDVPVQLCSQRMSHCMHSRPDVIFCFLGFDADILAEEADLADS